MSEKEKKPRKTNEETKEIVKKLVIMDDAMFEVMCEDPYFVEEMLQIIMENKKIRIKYDSIVAQKSIKSLTGRSVRLDAYVEGCEDYVFNIEIQKADNCNHIKRVRYNASMITVTNSEPGDEFEHVQNLCVIYISNFDMFGKGLTTYHVRDTILETGDVVENGLSEIYVNTEVHDETDISRLMELFTKRQLDAKDSDLFPYTYRMFDKIKNSEEGVKHMCEKIEAYANERRKENAKIYSVICMESLNGMSKEDILKKIMHEFTLSEDEAKEYYSELLENK